MRLLTLFLYYLRWQRTMAWTTAIGIAILALCLVLPPAGDFFAIMFGGGLAFGFPVVFAGVAFRQLVGHRRLLLIPDLRFFAAAALLALALVCSALMFVWLWSADGVFPGNAVLDPAATAAVTFILVSTYLLITQWLATHVLGVFALFLLPVVMLRLVFDDSVSARLLAAPWPLLVLAVAGWIWLFVSTRRPLRPRPLAIPRWQLGMSNDVDVTQVARPASQVATSAGTLMRGFGDGFRTRLAGAVTGLLLMPVCFVVVLWIIGVSFGESDDRMHLPTFFLLWSLIGGSLQAAQFHREWPARLRCLWLRRTGTRRNAWQLLETSMLGDVALITAIATIIAATFGLVTEVDPDLLILYVLGSALLTTLASYVGFLTRIAGWHSAVYVLFFGAILLLCFMGFAAAGRSGSAGAAYWMLAMLAAVGAGFRFWSRHRMLSIDWCAVRPAKVVRAGLTR